MRCITISTQQFAHICASTSLIALIALCVAWEMWLAPVRPGGSWLALKALPLLAILPWLLRKNIRAYQASALLIWAYVAEGATRSASDPNQVSVTCAQIELLLCLVFFVSVCAFARTVPYCPNDVPTTKP
jgi:uncharacterized membrane protein